MLLGIPRSARCVQRFDDSLKICNSLCSSSMQEPRDPLLLVDQDINDWSYAIR
ncbi:hypothetical protein BS17DRAFT_718546 [Gyrodon lividus]|nr:hypothetical protein BS17DRAFT_718546 [Gyrodon lividus]